MTPWPFHLVMSIFAALVADPVAVWAASLRLMHLARGWAICLRRWALWASLGMGGGNHG